MTNEKRQEAIVFALIASAIVHAAAMFYFRPKVMTVVVNDDSRYQRREAMRVSRSEARPNPVQVYDLDDIEAKKEAPLPENAVDSVVVKALDDSVADTVAEIESPVPEIIETSANEPIVVDPAVFEAEVIKLDEVVSGKIAAMPIDTPLLPVSGLAPNSVTLDQLAQMPVEMPEIVDTTPLLDPAPEAKAEEVTRFDAPEIEKNDVADFVPSDEVYETVDEKVIEAEKEAIRELLNDEDKINDLKPFVKVAATKNVFQGYTYFSVSIQPKVDPTLHKDELPVVPKDVVVLLDASGSIGNERLESCRIAGKRILRTMLNTGDRFNLVAFRDKYKYYNKEWSECSKESFDKADDWLNNLAAHGRTDVFGTISSVMTLPRDPTRPLIAMIVTDGEANTGISETAEILTKFTELNDGMISVYMYGVKSSANKELINVLTRGNRGDSYIHDGSRWTAGKQIDAFSNRFRDPALTDIQLLFTSDDAELSVYPRKLKNLYRGETLTFYGRVKGAPSQIAFWLKGLNVDKSYESYLKVPLNVAPFDPNVVDQWKNESKIDAKFTVKNDGAAN